MTSPSLADIGKLGVGLSLERLQIYNTNITSLSKSAVEGLVFKSLILKNNAYLTVVETGALQRRTIDTLRIENNALVKIAAEDFQATKIANLFLVKSKITEIEGGAFQAMTEKKIYTFYITDCPRLTSLADGLLQGFHITSLRIERNGALESIGARTFAKMRIYGLL